MIGGDPNLIAAVDTTGGFVDCVQLTDNGHRKLLLRLRKNGVLVEMRLSPAHVADFAVELQEVIDWLSEQSPVTGQTNEEQH